MTEKAPALFARVLFIYDYRTLSISEQDKECKHFQGELTKA